MSGSRPKPVEGHLAEQHLGDRLAALVDGELGHDARERVLAHVATCPKCKAEVDEQRRLKNVFAETAPPPPSESLLARLQGLPGGDTDGGSPRLGDGGFGGLPGRLGASGAFGVKRDDRFPFGYAPAASHAAVLPPSPGRGFRIHDVGRHDSDRPASRGLRFAFVAAGAVSLAAIALGGVTTGTTADTSEARGGSGSNVTPLRTQGTGATGTPESQRRRTAGPVLAQGGQQALGETPAAPTAVSAPLLPGGLPSPAAVRQHLLPLTTPVEAGAAVLSPLIRPLSATPPVTLTSWPTPSGLLAATVPDATSAPTPVPSPSSHHLP
ncbi:anti-sigma factor [Streptomyces sp. DH24]|uniref:anti-sigma factor family protein n=1 Tax=Streptomyces sp. DH24 TaxID=3040123 RepID=UPI002441C026|nr:zf-HC2 domain-containing protein [Streptomyces sp. DH24]MDG9716462.1 zf-HC2 domain-containing protein [Streptomyces sp. DH24]